MAIKKVHLNIDVVTAARKRIANAFSNGVPVYMSFSAGKDSLVMSHLVYEMIRNGEIDGSLLTVIFIDEEAIYPSMEDAAYRWRDNFRSIGVKFDWYCLRVKQVSIIDHLSATESWITWDRNKKDVWCRQPPSDAIMEHPELKYDGECNYQTFCTRITRDGIQMIGIRAAESVQRIHVIANSGKDNRKIYPIYDWKDTDVWLYIKEHDLEFPSMYMHLYEAGVSKSRLRLCCFFGDSSIEGLRWVAQTDPMLWKQIERREPNAYLVLLYWDSEMFQRSSRTRREMEKDICTTVDYKEEVRKLLFTSEGKNSIPVDTRKHLKAWRGLFSKTYGTGMEKFYKKMYEAIRTGDPKARTYRALILQWAWEYGVKSEKEMEDRRGGK